MAVSTIKRGRRFEAVESDSISFTANQRTNVTIPHSMGTSLKYSVVVGVPNGAWTFCQIHSQSPNDVTVGVWNSASSTVTGKIKVLLISD